MCPPAARSPSTGTNWWGRAHVAGGVMAGTATAWHRWSDAVAQVQDASALSDLFIGCDQAVYAATMRRTPAWSCGGRRPLWDRFRFAIAAWWPRHVRTHLLLHRAAASRLDESKWVRVTAHPRRQSVSALHSQDRSLGELQHGITMANYMYGCRMVGDRHSNGCGCGRCTALQNQSIESLTLSRGTT